MRKKLTKNLLTILMYSMMCYIILIPFKTWILNISVSILIGFLFGLLNEILKLLSILIYNKNNNNINE